ncbi:MAG TPA: hypothetical protein VFD01_10445 [Candidatus Dormibacteraeota bacterium]|nr:hypothetical protein [Candidatus Dormibacteraeota bacterium]
MEAAAAAGAVLAWLGVSLLSLADARRGLALGLVTTALGLALAAAASGRQPSAAAALAAGGAAGSLLRLRDGEPGWGLMRPGSTPRLVAALLVFLAAVLLVGSGLGVPTGVARLGAIAVALLALLRLLTVERRSPALGSGAALALGLGALGGGTGLMAAAVAAVALGTLSGAEAPGPGR